MSTEEVLRIPQLQSSLTPFRSNRPFVSGETHAQIVSQGLWRCTGMLRVWGEAAVMDEPVKASRSDGLIQLLNLPLSRYCQGWMGHRFEERYSLKTFHTLSLRRSEVPHTGALKLAGTQDYLLLCTERYVSSLSSSSSPEASSIMVSPSFAVFASVRRSRLVLYDSTFVVK